MVYTTPPQMNNASYKTPGQYSIVHQVDDEADTEDQAEWSAENAFPGSITLGTFKDGEGRVFKMHIRDHEGHVRTIKFDHSQHMSETDDGEC